MHVSYRKRRFVYKLEELLVGELDAIHFFFDAAYNVTIKQNKSRIPYLA